MKRKYRLIIYAVVALAIPVTSQLLFPNEPLWEPISFAALVGVLAGVYEVYSARKK